MIRQTLFAVAVILTLGALACNLGAQQTPPTEVISIPSAAPTAKLAPTLAPTETPVEGIGGGEGAFAPSVVLSNFNFDPTRLTVVDPVSGAALTSFTAPDFKQARGQWVAANHLFYLDDKAQSVRRAAFDGSLLELPFVNSGGPTFEGEFLPSPDGERIAWGTSVFDPNPEGDTHIQLKVANVDGSGEQTILDKRLKDESILPQPFHWSRDGRYLYFSNLPYGIGGYILFWGGPDLQQVDLATGTITEILPDQGCLCAMSLSPDGMTAAIITGIDPLELVLHDAPTGNERRTQLEAGHMQAGSIVWSPDGKSLMFTMAISDPEKEAYSIVRVDADTLAQTVLIRDDARLLETALWPEAKTVWLNSATASGGAWRMDAETGEVTLVETDASVLRVDW